MSNALLDYIKKNFGALRREAMTKLTDPNTLLNARGLTFKTILEKDSEVGETSMHWAINECLKNENFDLYELN